MPRNWLSRAFGALGVGALVVGAGLVAAAPASAAPVADANALRQAITDVNGTGPATEIELVPGATYSLPGDAGCGGFDENNNESGDLDILRTQPLTIFTPAGQPPAVLDMTCDPATTPQRVIQVLPPGKENTTGKLTLNNVVVRNGHATGSGKPGGGVFSLGEVTVQNSVFENNSASDGAPGAAAARDGDGGEGGSGGAVTALGTVVIENSTFSGNRAGRGGDGLSLADGKCDGRTGGAGGHGGQAGAIATIGGLIVTNSTFTGNSAGSGGKGGDGACGLVDAGPGGSGGNGGIGGSGGAIQCGGVTSGRNPQTGLPMFVETGCSGPMTVRGSTLDGNTSGSGGDGGAGGKAGPTATGGAGGIGGGGESNGLGFSGRGGAIVFYGRATGDGASALLVENSTLDGNSTGNGGAGGTGGAGGDQPPGAVPGNGGNGGGGGTGGLAGAIFANFADTSDNEVANLVHATITENGGGGAGGVGGQPGPAGAPGSGDTVAAAAAAGQPGVAGANGGGSLTIQEAWAALSTVVGTSVGADDGPDCSEPATSAQFSRASVDGCGFGAGSVQAFTSFALGTLADNGGPTMTRLPTAASGLVDKVSGVSGQLTADQRGVVRPQAAGADIGAVELQLIDMTVTKAASATTVPAGTEVTFDITVKNSGTSSPQPGVTIDDPNCTGLSQATGDDNTNNTLDPGETFAYTCKATPTEVGTFTNTVTATITDGAGVQITRTASVEVQVTAGAATPPLAKTGANNPTGELMIGAWLLTAGTILLLAARPRRLRIEKHTT